VGEGAKRRAHAAISTAINFRVGIGLHDTKSG
jgi:hypothetical protein